MVGSGVGGSVGVGEGQIVNTWSMLGYGEGVMIGSGVSCGVGGNDGPVSLLQSPKPNLINLKMTSPFDLIISVKKISMNLRKQILD